MEDILYKNSPSDVRIREMVSILSNTDKELPNLIILTILSAGTGVVTPIFSKDYPNRAVFTSIDEIGTKFILDGKEITSDDFLVVKESANGYLYKFFGLLFEDSNKHTLKVSLVNSTIPNEVFGTLPGFAPGMGSPSITSVEISNSITSIGDGSFCDCYKLTSVTIPNSVTSIGLRAFLHCSGLTVVTIPDSVISIGDNAFGNCFHLNKISSNAVIAPTITNITFQNVETNGTLHVPAGSNYSTWMSTDDYYLGKYNWTKVEDA